MLLKAKIGDPDTSRGGRLLARAPKVAIAAAVIIADLAFNAGLLRSAHKVVSPIASAGQMSCERGSCQRQGNGKTGLIAGVTVPTGKPRLLEFTSKFCVSCGEIAPLVRKLEHECTAHDGTLLPIDVDTDKGDLLATRYRIEALPTFVMIDSNGDEVRRLVGEQPRELLTVALADVNGVVCTVL